MRFNTKNWWILCSVIFCGIISAIILYARNTETNTPYDIHTTGTVSSSDLPQTNAMKLAGDLKTYIEQDCGSAWRETRCDFYVQPDSKGSLVGYLIVTQLDDGRVSFHTDTITSDGKECELGGSVGDNVFDPSRDFDERSEFQTTGGGLGMFYLKKIGTRLQLNDERWNFCYPNRHIDDVWHLVGTLTRKNTKHEVSTTTKIPTITEARFGDWEFYSGIGVRGTPVCGIISAVRNKDIGQNVAIKSFKDSETLHVDIYKDGWDFPQGTATDVTFEFMDNKPLTRPAHGDGHILDVEIPTHIIGTFLLRTAEAPGLIISFSNSAEPAWSVSLGASKAAISKLVDCTQRLKSGDTQPFESALPSGPALPRYDVNARCAYHSDNPEGSDLVRGQCLALEQQGYDFLKIVWPEISDKSKNECLQMIGGMGLYSLLADCIRPRLAIERVKNHPAFHN